MGTSLDLSGLRFGRLVVTARAPNRGARTVWACACDCGGEAIVDTGALRSGNTQSCGCLRRAKAASTMRGIATKHGLCGRAPAGWYRSWLDMHRRCSDPTSQAWKNYGGRGVAVCARWHDPSAFLADMGPRPLRATLDRIDNARGYEPGNCRWVSRSDQNRNKRTNHRITFGGRTMTRAQWARELGITSDALLRRLHCWPLHSALTLPRGSRLFTTTGAPMPCPESTVSSEA